MLLISLGLATLEIHTKTHPVENGNRVPYARKYDKTKWDKWTTETVD